MGQIAADDHLHMASIWSDNWTQKAGAPSAVGDPATMVASGQQHVFYRAADGSLRHMFWGPGAGPNVIGACTRPVWATLTVTHASVETIAASRHLRCNE